MVVLTWEMGVERGTGIWGVERGRWGWWRGGLGGDGDLGGGDCDVEGCGEGDLGDGDLWLFHQVRRVVEESGGGIGMQGNPHIVERGIWGWGSLPILPSKESCGREWRGNWYCRGTRTL